MNHRMIKFMLSRILLLLAALLIVPLVVACIYREEGRIFLSFIMCIIICLILSFIWGRKIPPIKEIDTKEGFIVCALSWFLLSGLGALPFFFSAYVPNYIDALFETASGFTTTGSSILNDIESLPHSLLFWRSFTHLIGGMGVLVFVIAIMPNSASNSANVNVLKAEIPGPIFGKLLPKIKDMTRTLYLIYLGMTTIVVILLCLGKMPLFDALIHAFGIAGTGGMSNKAQSIAAYQSPYIEYVVGLSLIAFGLNFNLYYLLLLKQFKAFYKNEELRWYLGIMLSAILIIFWNIRNLYDNLADSFRHAFFYVTSLMTSAGFCTVDYTKWPVLSQTIIVRITLIGACAGSTAGGIKVYRIIVLFKTIKAELIHLLSPRRVYFVKMDRKSLPYATYNSIHAYFVIYMLVFFLITLIISHDSPDFQTAFGATVATFNNIGPGIGAVGPSGNFSFYDNISKLTLTFSMIAGRLEILPVLICFSRHAWKRG